MGKTDRKKLPAHGQKPDPAQLYDIAVVGAGAAGSAAVLRSVLNGDSVLWFSGSKKELKRSRGTWVRQVDNMPALFGLDRTVLDVRNSVLGHLLASPFHDHLATAEQSVVKVQRRADRFLLTDDRQGTYQARFLILATGAMDEQPVIDGSIKPILPYANKQSVIYCIRCDGHRSLGKQVVVIGYSENAARAAVLLRRRYDLQGLTIITHGHRPGWSAEVDAVLKKYGISVVSEPIVRVIGEKKKGVLEGFQIKSGRMVAAAFAVVNLGMRVNNRLATQLGAELDSRGFVQVDTHGESTIPGVFAVGDLRSGAMKQIYTAFQQSVVAADRINRYILASQP